MRKALKTAKPALRLVGGTSVKGSVSVDSLAVAKTLHGLATQGEVRGLFVGYIDSDGNDHLCIAGAYRDDPARAVVQALRLVNRITAEEED